MDLNVSRSDQAFREEVRNFLADALSEDLRFVSDTFENSSREPMQRWQSILNQKGWGAPSWPTKYGGCGWTPVQQSIFEEEKMAVGAPLKSPFGLVMVGPVIYTFGSDEQKQQHLPSILDGSVQWCQGYSEPGSGSDLASLKTAAKKEGDEYVVNGQKIWTTGAHTADWMFCLVRTDTSSTPQSGISFLLIDMKTPGIEVRPIRTIDGLHHLNEVYFTDVRVPVSNLVGEENKGWTYAKFLLSNERASIAGTAEIRSALTRIDAIRQDISARSGPSFDDNEMRRKISELKIRLDALDYTERRALSDDGPAGQRIGMPLKLLGSDLKQDVAEFGVSMMATSVLPSANSEFLHADQDNMPAPEQQGPNILEGYMIGRSWTILGGTSEVQRGIMSKFVLGL